MTTRTLDLATYKHPHPPLIDWITANGLDPYAVNASQQVQVTDNTITVSQYVLDEKRLKVMDIAAMRPLEERVTVPLISPLEAHGIEVA